MLGRPDKITITWNKGLDQLQTGPFDHWMFREPQNAILEIGPHSVAHMLDLVGPIDLACVHASNALTLPGGKPFYRRWHIEAGQSQPNATLEFSFASGFTEHSIHVRGSLASATVDFERNTYILHRHSKYGLEFDSYAMTVSQSKILKAQARHTFRDIVIAKLMRRAGSPYGQSITNSIRSFYGRLSDNSFGDSNLSSSLDARLSPEFGRDVVQACLEIGRKGGMEPRGRTFLAKTAGSMPSQVVPVTATPPEILVLGATGFIGQELTRQLIARDALVRVLVRNPGRVPRELQCGKVQVIVGDLSCDTDIRKALEGIRVVYHLARPHVTTWHEYAEHEVETTRRIAKACQSAKVERLIYTGTIDSYYAGAKAGVITEKTPLDPYIHMRNYYAQAKAPF